MFFYQKSIQLSWNSFFFNIFLLLMVFAKGIGLDSGDTLYFVLAMISFPFWIIHIILIRWKQRKLLYSMALFSLACLVTVITRKTGIILSIMAIIAINDIDKEKYMKAILKLWFISTAMMILLVTVGMVESKIILPDGKTCYAMGYDSGNMFHAVAVILIILYLYNRANKTNWFEFLLIFTINYIAYNYSASRSGLIMGSVAIFLSYVIQFTQKRKRLNKLLMYILCITMILIVVLSFVIPLMHDGDYWGNSFPNVLNRLLTGRILKSKNVLISESITLFGKSGKLNTFVDNAYVFLIMKYGIIMAITICLLYIIALKNMVHRGDIYGIYMVFLFVLYGFTEQFFINSFMNYSLLLVGNEIMNVVLEKSSWQNSQILSKEGMSG